jgi:Arc/MetJ family transcription regulator
MRTTIRIDDALLAEAKRLAARTGRSLTAVVEDALREVVSRQEGAARRAPVHLTTVGGQGALPGVDLDDSAALLELMERPHDPA